MFFVRKLVLVCLNYNICFKSKHVPGLQNKLADSLSRLQLQHVPKHVPGLQNKLADSLSRLQLQTFKQLTPAYMHQAPTVIPPHLQPLSWVPLLPFGVLGSFSINILILHFPILFVHCPFHHLFWPYLLLICSIHGMLHPM